jgi:hypothetical protein
MQLNTIVEAVRDHFVFYLLLVILYPAPKIINTDNKEKKTERN